MKSETEETMKNILFVSIMVFMAFSIGVPTFANEPDIDLKSVLSEADEHERHEKTGASFATYFESNVLKVEGERITVSTDDGYTFIGREFTEGDVYAKIVFSIRDTQPFEQQVQLIQIQYIDFENAILVNHGARYDRDADVSIDHTLDELIEAMEDLTAFDVFEILE